MFSNNLKKLLAIIIAIALCQPAMAAWLPLFGSSVTQTDSGCSVTAGTTITFTAKNLGNINTGRVIAVSINWDDSTNAGTASITAVSVGGNAATRAIRASGASQNSNSEIWWLSLPAGATGDVVISSSTNIDGVTIAIYNLIGYNSAGPISTAVGTTSITQSFDKNNVALAAGSRTTNVSTSLSNMTNDFSSACGASLWGVHASTAVNGNKSLTSTISPTTNNPKIALAAWSPSGPFTTVFSQAMTNDPTNWTGNNLRVFFFQTTFNPQTNGNSVKLTVNAGTSNGMTVDHAYCGKSASPPNFDGDQVQVFSGGNASFTIAANGTLTLDTFSYNFIPANQFMCSFYLSGATANTEYVFTGNSNSYSKAGADEASLTTVTGYSGISSGYTFIISNVQVR